ncbi:MAG: hypothetical protein GY847_00520 [Proteobacteria bacterium]|nr:hypothetical protein [Pseudomonadota bacterium]
MKRMMRIRLSILGALMLLANVAEPRAEGRRLLRAGPADNPLAMPDYGGTPDISVPDDMGLSRPELLSLLKRLKSRDQAERAAAAKEIQRNAAGSETSMREVLWERHGARNSDMRHAIQTARRRQKASKKKSTLLDELLAIDPSHQDLGSGAAGATRILTLLRSLNSLDLLAAYKIMTEFSPRHAGVFRHEIGRMLVAHGYDVLPALIYHRGSDNKEIHMFAVKWIRDMGNPLLSEQVKIKNPRRLAQLLEAYASVNDLDAIDVTLSMTNHDSIFVRTAARRCLESFGRNAKWPVRRMYENTFAKEAAEDADVSSLLRILYDHFDAQRLVPMNALFNSGLEAFRNGRFNEMEHAFKEVLRGEPMFGRRNEMAEGFLTLSEELEQHNSHDESMTKLRLALRLAEPGSEVARQAEARIKWREAEALRKAGIAVPHLYNTVLKSDPEHKDARTWYDRLTGADSTPDALITKSLIVSFFIFLAATLVFLRLRS